MTSISISIICAGYLLCAFVWFLVELFIYNRDLKCALLMGAAWPILVYKLKTGRKTYPSRDR